MRRGTIAPLGKATDAKMLVRSSVTSQAVRTTSSCIVGSLARSALLQKLRPHLQLPMNHAQMWLVLLMNSAGLAKLGRGTIVRKPFNGVIQLMVRML